MKTYPLLVTAGSTFVTIYFDRQQKTYKIEYYQGKERKFRGAGRDEGEACQMAKALAREIDSGKVVERPKINSTIPASEYTPEKPMLAEEVVASFLEFKDSQVDLAKAAGGIKWERLKHLEHACRIFLLVFSRRLMHSITVQELEILYIKLRKNKIDLKSTYLGDGAKHRLAEGQEPEPQTVYTYFNRFNSVFVHARKLRAIRSGATPCWEVLKGKVPKEKTSQEPYTVDELKRLLPIAETNDRRMVRSIVLAIEGVRFCEFSKAPSLAERRPFYLYLTESHIDYGFTVDEEGRRIRVPNGSVHIPAELAKEGRLAGVKRHIRLTPFGKRYLKKYHGTGAIIIPLRRKVCDGIETFVPIDLGRALSRFIKKYEAKTGVPFRRNGLRHLGGSTRTAREGRTEAAKSNGHSPKIHEDFYDHKSKPRDADSLQAIHPLDGKPLPMPVPYGSKTKDRLLAPKSTPRGGNVPLAESIPLLQEFKALYKATCGKEHGWQMRLAQLLGCSNSCVCTWWKSAAGEAQVDRAPVSLYVRMLRELLQDKNSLALRLDPRQALFAATARRIKGLREAFQMEDLPNMDFEDWLFGHLAPTKRQVIKDWTSGKRAAGKANLVRLDLVLEKIRVRRGSAPSQNDLSQAA